MLRLALAIFMVVGCGVMKNGKQQNIVVVKPVIPEIKAPVDTIQIKVKDTPPKLQLIGVEPEIHQLIKESKDCVDTSKLIYLNIRWQEVALRAIDSARNRKQGKDSILFLLRENKREMANMRKENATGFKESRILSTGYSTMFETLGTVCFSIILFSYGVIAIVYMYRRFRQATTL